MGKFRPQDMLVVYALINVALCAVIVVAGGMVGIYAMVAISFFMSIMYPTQFSLALKDLGGKTKSGSAFLVMAIVGNVVMPPLTGYLLRYFGDYYYVAYIVPLLCFIVCGYYGWKGYKINEKK
jgi:FHS family L-fucose permease-like MFS transporter